MKRLIAGVFCIFLLFTPVTASACTIFMQSGEDRVLVGNNEDFYYAYTSMYWTSSGDNEYSRICFGNFTYVQGGMNEKGLFYDGAACPQSDVPYDSSKETLGMDAGDVVLSKCATVEEAVEFLSNYNIVSGYGDHLLFADSSGEAAVVEWLEGQMRVTWADNNRLITTNFFLTNTDLGGYPCDRYNTVENALKELSSLTPENFASILSSTSQNWGDGGTKYSNIYDLKTKTVYVYQKADFSNVAVLNLLDEAPKKDSGYSLPVDISTLSYLPVALAPDGVNTEKAAGTSLVTDDSLDTTNADIVASDNNQQREPDVMLVLIVPCVIVVAILAFYLLRRMSR